MTIGVVIPTRGDRATFLNQALYLLDNQTLKPHHVEIVDYPVPADGVIDTAARYKVGFNNLFAKGCDVVFCWEDDDYYSPIYIEVMYNTWLRYGKPELFGIGNTVYYHLFSDRYLQLSHPMKSSMYCTMVTAKVLSLHIENSDQYLDEYLWNTCRGKITAFTWMMNKTQTPIVMGMKHGIGKVAGGAHEPNSPHYKYQDLNKDLLRRVTGLDFQFYSKSLFALSYSKKQYETSPFLTIITRCYKRPAGFSKNQESIQALADKDIEQVFITDKDGVGLLEANKSFGNVRNIVNGDYVFLLDDDDFITNPDMVSKLKTVAAEHNPDVILFRMTIKNNMNNNHYPTDELCWGNRPVIARIGGSCFVVKRDIYKKFIHHFAKARCGDFYFIDAVFNSGASVYWLDEKMCETGKVSRGKPE